MHTCLYSAVVVCGDWQRVFTIFVEEFLFFFFSHIGGFYEIEQAVYGHATVS